jgi:hypothetical protein
VEALGGKETLLYFKKRAMEKNEVFGDIRI